MMLIILLASAAVPTPALVAAPKSPPPAVVAAQDRPGEGDEPTDVIPPPMIAVVPSPPAIVAAGPIVVEPAAVAPIRVRIVAGGRTLLDDELRVGRGSGASYNLSRSEAPSINCSADSYYSNSDRYSLTVQLYLRDDVRTGSAVNLNVTWQRPASTGVCPNEGSRSVSIVQTVPLTPGHNAVVRGDGGLVVTLSRR